MEIFLILLLVLILAVVIYNVALHIWDAKLKREYQKEQKNKGTSRKPMKHIFPLLLAVIMLLSFTGCTRNKLETKDTTPDVTAEEFTEVNETVYALVGVFIRSSAEITDNIVGALKEGDQIVRIGLNEEWSKVLHNGRECYIKSAYLSILPPETNFEIPDFQIPENVNNIGTFKTTEAVYEDILRNPGKHNYTKLTISNAIVIRDKNDVIHICHNSGPSWEFLIAVRYSSPKEEHFPITVEMKDDTQNRVLSGDLISITGVFIIYEEKYYLVDCTYEMVEANWFENNQ